MVRDTFISTPQTDAAIKTFDLAADPVRSFVAGANALTHEHLSFGQQYKVIEPIASNKGDALQAGQKVHFLGKTEDAFDQSLCLWFETSAGQKLVLNFTANAPQEADKRRYLRNAEAVLRPTLWNISKRRKQLTAARAVLLHLRRQQEASQ